MAHKHVYLNNAKKYKEGFNRKRGFTIAKKEDEDEKPEPTIKLFRITAFRQYYSVYKNDYKARYSNRSIEFPEYIDLIEISFLTTFNLDLKKKFYYKYGLLPVGYSDFNKTVKFEIIENNLFENFKNDLEYIISFDKDLTYSGESYNLIALIFKFRFINKRKRTSETSGITISTIQSNNIKAFNIQLKTLKTYLAENKVPYTVNETNNLIYTNEISQDLITTIEENFDIVNSIISSRALKVRPGKFGTLHTEYGFDVKIPNGLPLVGIIDTGVKEIEPLRDLIESTINIINHNDNDENGHGTLVAGLAIFGAILPSQIHDTYIAKCRVLPIKALHNGNDNIDFPKLLVAIQEANQLYGVRIFNMSLAFYHKEYNESYSDFAYELDKLAYELDILVFISVGNFDNIALHELLTSDYHEDHLYPDFFYKLNNDSLVHNCKTTNICTPSDSLNNISVGALAGNLEDEDSSDLTPYNIYPAYYTRKFNFDYEQKVNSTDLKQNQKNKNLNKPDFVFDGGDLNKEDSGIEVLSDKGVFFQRTTGTSLSTPLVTSIASEILNLYYELHTQSIKALLINSAEYYKAEDLPHFEGKESLLKKLTGFGIPDRERSLFSEDNIITMIIEDEIKPNEILSIPIFLPNYLIKAKNKLIFNISIAYSFPPDKGNHLGYLPLHLSFNLVKNVPLTAFDGKKEDYMIKSSFSWSEDHFGKENILFSNAQKKKYKLQPNDIRKLNGEVAIAVRCLIKENIDDSLKNYLTSNDNRFSLVIEIKEELKNKTDNSLYSQICNINQVDAIGDVDLDIEV